MAQRSSLELAVILHADGVGSTRLGPLDEALAPERIQDPFRPLSETINPIRGVGPHRRGVTCAGMAARVRRMAGPRALGEGR